MRFLKYFLVTLLAALLLALPAAADIEKNGKIVIVIDPGHGGVDGGSDKGTVPEKYYNMKLSEFLRDALEATGFFEVHMTRESDVYLKYLPRVLVAKEAGADLVISMHCNTVYENWVRGNSAYVSVVEEFAPWDLAGMMLDNLSNAVDIPRGKVYARADTGDSLGVYYWDHEKQWDMPGAWWLGKVSDYYSMITFSAKFGIPSVIIEHGYLTNWQDLLVLDSDDCLWKMAQAEADALVAYYTQHEHVFGEYETDFPSNCTFTGTESRHCTVCGVKSGTRDLPPAPDNHFWRQTGSATVSCDTDGFVSYVCQISYNANDKGYPCTVHQYSTTDKAPGHDYNVLEDSQPTHDTDGKLHKVCRTCGHEILEIREGEGHNWELVSETPATCEVDGEEYYECSVCEETKTETIPAFGHEFDIISDTEATHTEDGLFHQVCKTCGKEEKEIREAEGHSYDNTVSAVADCVAEVKYSRTCLVCGEEIEDVLPPAGHTEVFSEDGRESSCSVCGVILYTAPIPFYENPVYYLIVGAIIILSGTIVLILKRREKNQVVVAAGDEEYDEEDSEDEAVEENTPAEEIPYEYVEFDETAEETAEENAEETAEKTAEEVTAEQT